MREKEDLDEGRPKRRFVSPKKFVKDPYAWECVKVLINHLDPRDTTALDRAVLKGPGDFPDDYKAFDSFIYDMIMGVRKPFAGELSRVSKDHLVEWRGKSYALPLTEELRTVLSLLPFQIGVKAVLAKDALMREGFLGYECIFVGRKAPWKERLK